MSSLSASVPAHRVERSELLGRFAFNTTRREEHEQTWDHRSSQTEDARRSHDEIRWKNQAGFLPLACAGSREIENFLAFASEFAALNPCVDPLTSPPLGGTKALRFGRIGNRMKLYLIAGPNGVGKTTFARTFLPKYADCMEYTYRWLKAGGVMLLVIPLLRLVKCARLLSEHFMDLRVFRLTEPACLQFKQIVVLATRRKRHARISDAMLLDGVR
jgi:hypothetical protein